MNPNEISDRVLEQARKLQKTMADAAAQTSEQMKPMIEQSLKNAQELQKTLSEQAAKSASLNQEYANKALGHLSELMKLGADALKANAEQTRTLAQTMMDTTRKTVESATTAASKST